MATNNRDIKMTLSVETLGTEDLKKLQTEVEKLAREGGDAAPKFQKLADELSKLGSQNEVLSSFQQLAAITDTLSAKQLEASTSLEKLTTDYTQAREATDKAAQAQRSASAAYDKTQKDIQQVEGQLKTLRATTDAAGKKTDDYKTKLTGLIAKQTELKTSLIDLGNERRKANTDLTAAENAEKKIQTALTNTQKTLDETTRKLGEQKSNLDQSRAAVEQFGLSTDDIAGSQLKLQNAFTQVAQSAQNLTTEIRGSAQAERDSASAAKQSEAQYQKNISSINDLIKVRRLQAAESEAAAEREAAAQQAASQAAIAAKRAEQQESDRLFALQEAGRERLAAAGRQALLAELAAQRDATETTKRLEAEKQAAVEATAKANAQAITDAFRTVGVRGAAELKAEVDKVRAAMNTLSTQAGLTGEELRSAMNAGQREINELEREMRRLNNTLTLGDKAAMAFKNSMGQIAVGNIIADAVGVLVEKVKEMGRAFIEVSLQADTMRRGLNAIYKDTAITSQQIDFLRSTATNAGVSISNITNDFVKFSAATAASNIPLQTTNAVFQATVKAAASLGLGADKTSLALNALGQIASKGVVSMEELRQQLGDSIPGALSLTAKGLGITDAQLIQLVETGQLASRDFFPAFAEGLKTLQGETNGLRNMWDRFKNTLTVSAQAAGAAGALNLLAEGVRVLSFAVGGTAVIIQGFFETLSLGARVLGTLAGAFATFTNPLEALNEVLLESSIRQKAVNDTYLASIGVIDEATAAESRMAAAKLKGADADVKQTTALQTSTQAIAAYAAEAEKSKLGQEAAAAAIAATGSAVENQGKRWVGLITAIQPFLKKQQLAITLSEKNRAGVELEAEAIERIAKLRGDEATQLQAAAQAAELNQAALTRVAQARRAEADILAVQLQAMVQEAIAQDGSITKREAEIAAIEKKLLVAREEAANSENAVEKMRLEVAQRELAIQTYKDNSAVVEQLAVAYKATQDALDLTIIQEKFGLATKEDVKAATEAAAKAYALYADAVGDAGRALQAKQQIEQASFDIKVTGIRLLIAEKQAEMEVARAKGDTYTATKLANEIKKLEIELLRLTAEAKRAEARASLAAAEATRTHLIATNNWNDAAEAAYQASVAKAKALEAEAKIAEITAKKLEELAKATKQAGDAARGASSDYDKLAGSLNNVAEASENANSASSGSSGSSSSSSRISGSFSTGVPNFNSTAEADLWWGDYQKRIREAGPSTGSGMWASFFQKNTEMAFKETRRALERKELASKMMSEGYGGQAQNAALTQSAAPSSGGTPVTINLNGSSRRINVASQSDASALEALLRELESSSGRSV
jgi:tape measure domain-containing protein